MDTLLAATKKKKDDEDDERSFAEIVAQSQKNLAEGKSYSTGQKQYHGDYIPKREPKGSSKGGRFAKGSGKTQEQRDAEKADKAAKRTAVETQISTETEAERARADQERGAATAEREKRTGARQAEDAARELQRAQEDVATAEQGRTTSQAERDLRQIQQKRERSTKILEQLRKQRGTARGDRSKLYDEAIAKAEGELADLGKDEDALTEKVKQSGSTQQMQSLRDRVRLSRKTEDIGRRTSRQAEDAAARAASQGMRDRIAARRREMQARHSELRKTLRGSLDIDGEQVALLASLRLRRRRMLVRAGLTADLSERAILQASAAAVRFQMDAVATGVVGSLVASSGGFDGAAIVLLADDGTVTYPDGETAPLHVTLAYLGPAGEMTPSDVDAATGVTKRVAGSLDPFTPAVLSPARFGDTDVLLLEHPDIQRAHDVALTNRNVAGLVDRHDEHPHFVPHCAGATTAPHLGRAALLMGGEDPVEFPLDRRAPEEDYEEPVLSAGEFTSVYAPA